MSYKIGKGLVHLAFALLLCMTGWVSAHNKDAARRRFDDDRALLQEHLSARGNGRRHFGVANLVAKHHHHHSLLLHDDHDHHEEPCGTPGRSAAQRQSFEKRRLEHRRRGLGDNSETVVPVCFHVIRPEQEEETDDPDAPVLDNDLLQVQLDYLNYGFSSQSCCASTNPWCQDANEKLCSIETDIRFEMAILPDKESTTTSQQWDDTLGTSPSTSHPAACITQTRNNKWYNATILSEQENTMMHTLRIGGADVLNIVYNDLRYYFGMKDRLLGHALLPDFYALYGDIDGVVIAMKGIVYPPDPQTYEYDMTIVHEVGHWLGLEHTFLDDPGQGGSCGPTGDKVGDTPAEKLPASQCNIGRDTCPSPGFDPIHNYMDYTRENCMYEFTPGQRERMLAAVHYRQHFQHNPEVTIQDREASEPVDLMGSAIQTYKLEIVGPSDVVCLVSSEQEDEQEDDDVGFEIFLRFDEKAVPALGLYDCYTRAGSCQASTFESTTSTVWIHVSPQQDANGVSLICYDRDPSPTTLISYGVPTNINLRNEELFLELELPTAGSWITCQLSGEGGDADIAIRFDHLPSRFAYSDAVSIEENTSNEMVWVQVPPDASRAYVLIFGREAPEEASFTCFTSEAAPVGLVDRIPSDPMLLEANRIQIFALDVETGIVGVECSASTKSGDGWLAVNWGNEPRHGSSSCTSESIKDPCRLSYPGTDNIYDFIPVVYALVRATDGMEDLTVTCTALLPDIQSLGAGSSSTSVTSVELLARESAFFVLDAVENATVTCSTGESAGGEGDVDLYLSFDKPVFPYNARRANCSSESSDSVEKCSVTVPENTTKIHVLLRPFGGSVSGVRVACTTDGSTPQFEPPSSLASGRSERLQHVLLALLTCSIWHLSLQAKSCTTSRMQLQTDKGEALWGALLS